MVRKFSMEDGGDSTNDAAIVRVVLAGARDPFSILLDVDLAHNMVVPESHGGHDRYWVMLVVDVLHTSGKKVVHEAREDMITNPRHTVPDNFDVGGWS